MLMGAIVLVIAAFITYAWVVRGFFSAMVHLACTVVAGAVALGLWEPLGHWLLNASGDRGVAAVFRDSAWAIALALPFALTLGILRLATNKLLPANARCDDAFEYVGGGVCGLASAVLTLGIFMLSIGFLRFGPDALGYQPLRYTSAAKGRGSIEREPGILLGLVPRFDVLTARFYEQLSLTSLRTGEPLGKWHPRFDDVPWANRMTYQGRSRNTLRTREREVLGWYTVGLTPQDANPATGQFRGGPLDPLLTDEWNDTGQSAIDLDGNPITTGYVAGFRVRMTSGAREKQGQILVGNGQVRLVVESVTDEEYKSLHPVAAVTNMGLDDLGPDQKPASARFRYDGNEVFFSSVGGASDANMWFEFAVPAGYRPIGLYIKNARWEVPEGPPTAVYGTPAERDKAVKDLGGILAPPSAGGGRPDDGIMVSNGIGQRIQRGSHGTLQIDRQGRSSVIVNGEYTFNMAQLKESLQGLPQELVIDRFAATNDTCVVKVDVSMNTKASLVGRLADAADPNVPPVLEDANGQLYEAVGYVYSDTEKVKIRYTLGQPIRGVTELNSAGVMISKSRPDQKLVLVFRPTFGVKIRAFKIGSQTIAEYDPPVELTAQQGAR